MPHRKRRGGARWHGLCQSPWRSRHCRGMLAAKLWSKGRPEDARFDRAHTDRPAVAPGRWHQMRQPALDPERLDALADMPQVMPRPTVLIVDDEPSIVDLLCEFLEDSGYHALLARNGRTALAIARREHPALVLTDRNMPGIDGVDLLRRLRSSPTTSNIPVVIMSSTRPTSEGTDRVPFLAKPFDLDDMLATVATYAGPPEERRR